MRYFALFLSLILTACQEEIVLDLDNSPQLMVDGLITDQLSSHYVRLNLTTTDFSLDDTFVPARGAYVVITDSLGITEVLEELPNQPGVYLTGALQGIVGQTYYLFICYQGKEYSAQSTLLPVNDDFRLEVKFHREFGSLEEGYYIYYIHEDPDDTVAYYRHYVYRNDSLLNGRESIWATPARPPVENRFFGKRISYPFKIGDTVRVDVHPLDEGSFIFYTELERFVDYDSDIFSPPPIFPTGNITNNGLGIFRASAISSQEIEVK